MSWAEEDWTVGLSGRVLQKVKELQVHQERLSRENKQKQLQLDNLHTSLKKQTAKVQAGSHAHLHDHWTVLWVMLYNDMLYTYLITCLIVPFLGRVHHLRQYLTFSYLSLSSSSSFSLLSMRRSVGSSSISRETSGMFNGSARQQWPATSASPRTFRPSRPRCALWRVRSQLLAPSTTN